MIPGLHQDCTFVFPHKSIIPVKSGWAFGVSFSGLGVLQMLMTGSAFGME